MQQFYSPFFYLRRKKHNRRCHGRATLLLGKDDTHYEDGGSPPLFTFARV